MLNCIKVKGNLQIIRVNIITGEETVISGSNLVLNSGLEMICKLIVGDITFSDDIAENTKLSTLTFPLGKIVQYMQLGSNDNNTAPHESDSPSLSSGLLNTFSPVLPVRYYYPTSNSVTIQSSLSSSKGNTFDDPLKVNLPVYYREAVLMAKTGIGTYAWFARKTFSDVLKDSSTLLKLSWTLQFSI